MQLNNSCDIASAIEKLNKTQLFFFSLHLTEQYIYLVCDTALIASE